MSFHKDLVSKISNREILENIFREFGGNVLYIPKKIKGKVVFEKFGEEFVSLLQKYSGRVVYFRKIEFLYTVYPSITLVVLLKSIFTKLLFGFKNKQV